MVTSLCLRGHVPLSSCGHVGTFLWSRPRNSAISGESGDRLYTRRLVRGGGDRDAVRRKEGSGFHENARRRCEALKTFILFPKTCSPCNVSLRGRSAPGRTVLLSGADHATVARPLQRECDVRCAMCDVRCAMRCDELR
eukprot:2844436-Rhodomonas_salina.1